MTRKLFLISMTIALIVALSGCNKSDENWTHFRGSHLDGVSSTSNIPLQWGEKTMKWKTEIHDKGWSSPVIWKDQVWVTTAKTDGKDLYAVCVDFKTGKIIYDIDVFTTDSLFKKHEINSFATPTPCIEDGFLYVHYGSLGTACLSTKDGSVVWRNTEFKCDYMMGPASSPVIYKNLLILHFEGIDRTFIVALDKSNGQEVWKTDRPKEIYDSLPAIGRKSYTTPIITTVGEKDLLVSSGSYVCIAYDPMTGKEIWRVVRGGESAVAMPFTENGTTFWYTGFMYADDGSRFCEILAVDPSGEGDITGSNIKWRKKSEYLQLLTPVVKNMLIYTVDAKNNMMCIDAANGEELWTKHVTANYNASPLYIDGNVWFFSVKGDVLVLKEGRTYEVAGSNKMDSGIWATPAALRNSLIIRTEKYLCRIAS